MARVFLTFVFATAAFLLAVQSVRADTGACMDRAALVARLAAQYGENRQAAGLAGPDRLVELFASIETGSWTLVVTAPSGIACLLGAGEHFLRFEAEPAPDGDPA